LSQTKRFHEILEQNFARMDGRKLIVHLTYLYE
jgi:hypothetical protein